MSCLFHVGIREAVQLCRLQEKHTREKLRDHLQAIASLQTELLEVRKRLTSIQSKIRASHDRRQKLLKSSSRLDLVHCSDILVLLYACSEEERQFIMQSSEAELVTLFRSHDDLQEQQQELETRIDEMEDHQLP